jgi:hypothetical protein
MYPTLFTTPGVKDFAEAVDAERQRQIAKWGDQHHPDGTGPDQEILPGWRADELADAARNSCQTRADMNICTWADIFSEEACEALAEYDPVKLRAELVQCGAVIAAWIADIDSRDAP